VVQGRGIDTIFLAGVVLLSVSSYAGRLGFYGDDWAFQGFMATSPDQSFGGLIHAQWFPLTRPRPAQIVYQAALHWLFGTHPLAYHLVNAGLLCAMTILLYWVLREFGIPRVPSLAVAAVYGLMPNYSTDRFWFAAFGYVLSMVFLFFSFYADLRAIRSGTASIWCWKALALGALVVSCLGYEVVVPLFVVGMPLIWLKARSLWQGGLVERLGRRGSVAYVGTHYIALGGIVAYKAATTPGIGTVPNYGIQVARVLFGSVATNYGTFVAGLPQDVWLSIHGLDAAPLAVGVASGALIFGYLLHASAGPASSLRSRASWAAFGLGGLIVFLLGYGIFLVTERVAFASTGIFNRLSIAGALGVAISVVAAIGWVSRPESSSAAGRWAFSAAIAILCAGNLLVTEATASDWALAAERQRVVLASIHEVLQTLPPHSTLILHGVCPYIGPAIVFESSWDLKGALQVELGDPTLEADVTSGRLRVEARGISTSVYGPEDSAFYAYGPSLLLFDDRTATVTPLLDRAAVNGYLRQHPLPGCPPGGPGVGVPIFPMDRLLLRLEGELGLG